MKRLNLFTATAVIAILAACQDFKSPVAPDARAGGVAQFELVDPTTSDWLGEYDQVEVITDENDDEVGTLTGTLTLLSLVPTSPNEYTATGTIDGIGSAPDGTVWPIADSFELPVQEQQCADGACLKAKKQTKVHCPPSLNKGCFITPTIHKGKKKKK